MKRHEKGFTLIEILIAVSISTLVVVAASIAVYQVMRNTQHTSNRMTAVLQVQNAGDWISRDTLVAQSITTGNVTTTDFLTFGWTEIGSGDEWHVVYTLEDMPGTGLKTLVRSQSVNGGDNSSTLIARFIVPDAVKTLCEYSQDKLNLTITATVGDGPEQETETRKYEIVPRSS